jgi:hypothetical protein
MTAVAIVREDTSSGGEPTYRAVSHTGKAQSIGRTPGEALDALTAQLGEAESGTLVVVQHMRPDRFFSEAQIRRLDELLERRRLAQAAGQNLETALTVDEEAELAALIQAELLAAADRASALADALGR